MKYLPDMKPVKHLYEMYKDVKALLTANETKADDKADPQVARDNNFSTSRFCLIQTCFQNAYMERLFAEIGNSDAEGGSAYAASEHEH